VTIYGGIINEIPVWALLIQGKVIGNKDLFMCDRAMTLNTKS